MKKKSIVLIGFMGVGKSTIGKELARKLNRNFIDIDSKIEREFNMPITGIFQSYGEQTFRRKEKELIQAYTKQNNLVISVGGGAFLQKKIKDICISRCTVVFLGISWESWKERITFLTRSRPVLQGKTTEEIKDLFYERQPLYNDHHIKVETDSLTINKAANLIINRL